MINKHKTDNTDILYFSACSICVLSWLFGYLIESVIMSEKRSGIVTTALALTVFLSIMITARCLKVTRRNLAATAGTLLCLIALQQTSITNSVRLLWILLFAFIVVLIRYSFTLCSNERINRAAMVLGTVFSVCIFIGYQLKGSGKLAVFYSEDWIETKLLQYGFYAATFFGWQMLLEASVKVLFYAVAEGDQAIFGRFTRKTPVFQKNRKTLFIRFFLIILLVYSVFFFVYYPGIVSSDSRDEIMIQTGMLAKIDSSPVIHQWVIRLCVLLGKLFGEGYNNGVAVYSILQMIFLSAVFACSIVVLGDLGASEKVQTAVLAFYTLFGVNQYYSITMWKNIPFAAFALLLIMMLIKNSIDNSAIMNRRFMICLIVVAFCFSTFQHNGFPVFIIAFPFYILKNEKKRRLLTVYLFVILLFTGYKGLLYNVFGYNRNYSGEALSIPAQQIARVVKKYGIEGDREEFEILEEVFPQIEELGEKYKSYIADPVKGAGTLQSDVFRENPLRYARAWLKIGIRHPLQYLEAFLLLNYGYWYPDAQYWSVMRVIDPNPLDIRFPERGEAARRTLYLIYKEFSEHLPTTILYSVAFMVWLLWFSIAVLWIKKEPKILSSLPILLILWITTLGSPVFCEYRYLYALVLCIPFILVTALLVPNRPTQIPEE